MDISNKLQTALIDIDNNISFLKNKVEKKQNAITSQDKLSYDLLSGTPTIPLSTSQLTNDSDFITSGYVDGAISGKLDNPSGGTEGQVLTKTANGEAWEDAQGGGNSIVVDDKVASGAFIVDFAGGQIQKYDVGSAVSGSLTITYDNLDIPEHTAPTVELQIPVTGDVSSITLPNDTSVIDMPVILEGGVFKYHDIVFRAQKDFNDAVKVYANYAYKFDEEIDYFYLEALENGDEIIFANHGASVTPDLKYSTDKVNWSAYTIGSTITLTNVGDRVYFKGINTTFGTDNWDCHYFEPFTKNTKVGGNLMTLFDETGASKAFAEGTDRNARLMFYQCAKLKDASDLKLPATTLRPSCYSQMFSQCSALSAAPKVLPAPNATDSACYADMFTACDALTKSPKIMATTIGSDAMWNMFSGCRTLNDIEVHFTEWTNNATNNWVGTAWGVGVASTGTFKCPAALDTTTRDESHVPANWTIVNI